MNDAQHAAWCEEYRKRRYLEYATHEELTQRLDEIFVNFICFTDDGEAVVHAPLEKNPYAALFVHVLEEMNLRGRRQYAFPVKNLNFDNSKYPNVGRASALRRGLSLKLGSCMFKFGALKYLRPLLEHGVLRVNPASSYRESLVAAIRDEELEFTHQLCGGTVRCRGDDGNWRTMSTVGPVRITHRAKSDYYVSCYTVLYENRLFDDFQANACLVIKDLDGFGSRLSMAFTAARAKWDCLIGGVQYCDPYNDSKIPDVYFSKYFRFAYQREFRMVWIPQEPQHDLQPIDLELGDLTSICELLCL